MSDVSAGQPVAEPVGPPPGPAPIDQAVHDASSETPAPTQPRAAGTVVADTEAAVDTDRSRPSSSPDAVTSSPADDGTDGSATAGGTSPNPRRRRRRPSTGAAGARERSVDGDDDDTDEPVSDAASATDERPAGPGGERPRIGDTRPARAGAAVAAAPAVATPTRPPRRPSSQAKAPGRTAAVVASDVDDLDDDAMGPGGGSGTDQGDDGAKGPGGRSRRRSGRERRGRPVGRYLMCVHVRDHATQIAVLEGRTLVEHQVSRAADDATQIDGNIYRGRVQNVLPGMEAAFVDIGTPKNAVLYRGDVRYDTDDVETSGGGGGGGGGGPRIEQMLRAGQTILCQVTKNPIGAKGARLTQEVSLPGRFVVMVPNSSAFGISKRLDDAERKRLRRIVDDVRPKGHGLIVRTAAEGASQEELGHDVERLAAQWASIEAEAGKNTAPGLLYREPDLAVRSVREEFNREYRGVVIDDEELFLQVRDYIEQVNPELADRVELYDPVAENMPVFERFHVHEQLHKALDRKVWLPSGGSLIIERTEALTVIDVNTGKNVGTSNLEETVYRNNLEAAEEIARQLRLRDIGGIIVIDFIDMEIRDNRDKVASALRSALSRDKTRTQVFDISELGLVEMTRKRVSEGLVESLSSVCAVCGGRGIVLDDTLL
jgi:ribonuclease E